MANRKQKREKFSKKRLKEALDYRGYNIDTLCNNKNVGIGSRQAWRYWKEEEMPPDILDNFARELNVSEDFISGKLDRIIKESEDDPIALALLLCNMTPENHPYSKSEEPFTQMVEFYNMLFKTYHITEEEQKLLSPHKRIDLLQKIDNAIVEVLIEYFPSQLRLYGSTSLTLKALRMVYDQNEMDFLDSKSLSDSNIIKSVNDYVTLGLAEINNEFGILQSITDKFKNDKEYQQTIFHEALRNSEND